MTDDPFERHDGSWTVPSMRGLAINQVIDADGHIHLHVGSNQIEIAAPGHLRDAEDHLVTDLSMHEAADEALRGKVLAGVTAGDDGRLDLRFADGTRLEVRPAAAIHTWRVGVRARSWLARTPEGAVTVTGAEPR